MYKDQMIKRRAQPEYIEDTTRIISAIEAHEMK